MPDLTPAFVKAYDAKRRILMGAGATLALLDHTPQTGRGYVKIKTVAAGWWFRGRPGRPGKLAIAEQAEISEALITKAVAYSINGFVYKLQTDGMTPPSFDVMGKWEMEVKPTGERVEF